MRKQIELTGDIKPFMTKEEAKAFRNMLKKHSRQFYVTKNGKVKQKKLKRGN